MPKKENNRRNFTGYKNWQERKEARNATKAQVWVPKEPIEEGGRPGYWAHIRAGEVIAVRVS